jgi:histidinol phosphatase-like PHP family hydrolase
MSALGTQDLHCHTTFSDGHLSLQEVVDTAESLGVQVGVADHVSTRGEQFIRSAQRVAEYLDALDQAPVFRSAEFCWCDSLWREIPEALMRRFDYCVGSNHGFWLPDGTMASPWGMRLAEPWSSRPQEVMDAMVANLCEMVGTMPIRIAAHSTLTPPALFALEDDVDAWWSPEREDRYVEALAASGVALEISNRYQLPHDRLLIKARQAGVRFSLGSDGHSARQVARLDWAAETARRVGVGDDDLFVPERRLRS